MKGLSQIFSRAKREQDNSFIKFVYLKNDEVWYQLSRDGKSEVEFEKFLDVMYPNFIALNKEFMAYVKFIAVIIALGLVSLSGVVSKLEFLGIEFTPQNFSLVCVPALAALNVLATSISVKKFAIQAVFERHFFNKKRSERGIYVLKYPEVMNFNFFRLNYRILPIHLLPGSLFVEGVFAAVIVITSLFMLLGSFFFYSIFVVQLWGFVGLGYWPKLLTIVSLLSALGCFLIPSAALRKNKYSHYGLLHLMQNINDEDPKKSTNFNRINRARESMKSNKKY